MSGFRMRWASWTPRERMVFELEALPRIEAANDRRDVEYDRRDGKEYAVSRDTQVENEPG